MQKNTCSPLQRAGVFCCNKRSAVWKRSDAGVAAVHGDDLAGHVAGLFRAEEYGGGIQFAAVAVEGHGDGLLREVLEVFGIQGLRGQLGVEVARADGVDGDAALGQLRGSAAGEVDHRALGGMVGDGGNGGVAHKTVNGGDVDDAAVGLLAGFDILLHIPTMKPIGQEKQDSAEAPAEQAPAAEAVPVAPIVEEKIDFSNVQIEPLFEDQVDFETFSKSDFRAVKVLACEAVPKSKKLLKFTLDDGSGTERTILSGIHSYYEPEQLIGKTCIAIVNLPPRKMMGIDSCGMLISAVHKEGEEEKLHLLMVDPSIPAGAKLY